MDAATENRLSMFLKVRDFLKTNETALSAVPAIVPVKDEFFLLLDATFTEAGLASDDIEGFTDEKKAAHAALVRSMLQVSRALFAYWLVSATEGELRMGNYSERTVLRYPDSKLHLRAEQLYETAEPVKALLAPYNCTVADVDALLANKQQFFTVIEKPKAQRRARAQARKRFVELMKQGTALLKTLDIYLATFSVPNPNLFYQYQSARAIDNMRGKRKKKAE